MNRYIVFVVEVTDVDPKEMKELENSLVEASDKIAGTSTEMGIYEADSFAQVVPKNAKEIKD